MEEPPLLVSVELVVGCVNVENNLLRSLPSGVVREKMIDKESRYPLFIVDKLLVAILRRNTCSGGLQSIQRALARQCLAEVFAS